MHTVTTWEIRQQVRTVDKGWLVCVFSTQCERTARHGYDSFVKDHPEAYFELIRVEHSEDCLAFTPKNDDGTNRAPVESPLPEAAVLDTGVVKWFDEKRGYGYIAPDRGSNDLFAHFSQVQGGTLKEGMRVRFGVSMGPKGRQATGVEVVDA